VSRYLRRFFFAVVLLGLAQPLRADDIQPAARDAEAVARLVAEAMGKGLDGDWDRASALVAAARQKGARDDDVPSALSAGVMKWDAPPVLTIDEPKDASTL